MSIAIIKTGGKQYKVKAGDVLEVEKLSETGKKTLEFTDLLAGKKVEATIEKQTKGPKVRIFKYKSKSKYRRTTGHRQKYSQIKIDKISW